MAIQNVPAEQLPHKYIYGLSISNNATTPNKKVDVAIGQCSDTNNTINMVYNVVTTIDCTATGANALDTGSLAASSFYKIFAIGDSANYQPSAFIITLQTNSAPLMPLGYDSYRLIGFMLTDSSSNFLKFYMSPYAANNLRYVQYDAPITITVTGSGISSGYSPMDLSVAVPTGGWEKVKVYAKWSPSAAGNVLTFQAAGGTGNWLINTATTTQPQDLVFDILPQISSSVPKISYKINAGTLTAVTLLGYNFLV